MTITLTPQSEARVLAAVQVAFPKATIEDVLDVNEYGSVQPGVVGDDYDEALTDKIQEELDKIGDAA